MNLALMAIDFVLCVAIVLVSRVTAQRLRGSTMFWVAAVFIFTGLTSAAHAFAAAVGLGAGINAVSSYVAAILLFFSIVVVDMTSRLLGVQG